MHVAHFRKPAAETDDPDRTSRGQKPTNAARALPLRNSVICANSPSTVEATRSPMPGIDSSRSRLLRNPEHR